MEMDMSEWKPIETAPKDGTRFLACCCDPDSLAGGEVDPYDGIELLSGPHTFAGGKKRWLNHNSGNYSHFPATHWMPLPAPPTRADPPTPAQQKPAE